MPYGQLMTITYGPKPLIEDLAGILIPVNQSIRTKQNGLQAGLTAVSLGIKVWQRSIRIGHTPIKEVTNRQ